MSKFVVLSSLLVVGVAIIAAYSYSSGGVDDDALNVAVATQSLNDVSFMFEAGTREEERRLPPPDKCREIIKSFVNSSYQAYRKYAWGFDELKPLSKRGFNWYPSATMGVTVVDSLDMLLMLGKEFEAEVDEAIKYIANEVDFTRISDRVSFFEVIIRVLGGLLSSYHLTRNEALLRRAVELGDLLLDGATDGGRRVIPRPYPHLSRSLFRQAQQFVMELGNPIPTSIIVFGSVQLELRALSHFSGDAKYARAAESWMKLIEANCKEDLCPLAWKADGTPSIDRKYIWQAGLVKGDSFYEYILKQYVQSNRTDKGMLKFWNYVAQTLKQGHPHWSVFVPNFRISMGQLHHLSCFAGGMFALSSRVTKNREHLEVAKKIAEGCAELHRNTATGLPRELLVVAGDQRNDERGYRLRPEIMETLFYLWRETKDQKYRRDAWTLLANIYKHLYVPATGAFASTTDVDTVPVPLSDRMDSFWIAETLKYAFLIFSDDDVLSLDSSVLTTEAHILPVFRW